MAFQTSSRPVSGNQLTSCRCWSLPALRSRWKESWCWSALKTLLPWRATPRPRCWLRPSSPSSPSSSRRSSGSRPVARCPCMPRCSRRSRSCRRCCARGGGGSKRSGRCSRRWRASPAICQSHPAGPAAAAAATQMGPLAAPARPRRAPVPPPPRGWLRNRVPGGHLSAAAPRRSSRIRSRSSWCSSSCSSARFSRTGTAPSCPSATLP